MRTEKEIRDKLDECLKVAGWGMSEGPCPLDDNGEEGCCAECSFPSAIQWVLGESVNPSYNAQNRMIDIFKPKENQDERS